MTDIQIETGNDELEIVLVQRDDYPLRVLRWGSPKYPVDLPEGQPAVEIVTVDSGHSPSTSRITEGELSTRLRYARHRTYVNDGWTVLEVVLKSEDLMTATLRISTPPRARAARVEVSVTNDGPRPRIIQSITSIALRIALGAESTTDPGNLVLSSARNDWLGESRWTSTGLREAGVPELVLTAHGDQGARGGLSVASSGSWSTGRALPVGIIEVADACRPARWENTAPTAVAWQIEHNGGWRWEVGEDRLGTYLALCGPTDIDHQWVARLETGESFTTVPATIGVGSGIEGAVAALTDYRREARRQHSDNEALSVVFNDYMNTLMGDPTTKKLLPLIDAAAEAGAEYFCIDAGWYDDSGDWWYSVGDWQPSTVRFPGGLEKVIEHIRNRDMVPGLWLEPEVVGVDSPALTRLPEEAFLSRYGERVVEHGRYHLDLRHPAAIAHLNEVIDRLVNQFGVGYFKLDYNINPGAGTDLDAVSPGDGLLQHNRAHLTWLDTVLDRHPDLVLENCGSGAMRMDFAMLARLQLQSTSDQQDAQAYAPIAAAAPIMMLPEQAANWAYPQSSMTDEAFAFTLCTGMLGRFYLSGYLDKMTMSQQILVAEAVAAHKRLRHELAVGHPSWPLGIDQWSAPWVALAIGQFDMRYLTLWKRDGAEKQIQIPLPDLIGQELIVDTVFPRRLEPWNFSWDSATGILSVISSSDEAGARTLRISTSRPTQRVQVDAGSATGKVHGGATGMLYGLGDPGVPAQSLIAGVRPRTMAQKAPLGKQHPNGDAIETSESYFAAGGTEMVVYMQDALEQWPYEDRGIDHLVSLAREMVSAVASRSDADRFVWVPFNEGDWIWYPDWAGPDRARFLSDWSTMHAAIKAVAPTARIVGPNESHYFPDRVRDFLEYCLEYDVLPDIMSWHELQPSSLEVYLPHYEHYRSLERQLGVGPLPINIDEYGNRRDMSNPAQLLQWITMFETTKVDADLAYWTLAGNLDDHAVNTRQANGGWWLLHWYAGLSGNTVKTTVPHPRVRDSVRALAAIDSSGALSVITGGMCDDITLEIDNLHFDGAARVKVSMVAWTGYEGDLTRASVLIDMPVTVADGSVRLLIPNSDPTAAYLVVITPGKGGATAELAPWTCTFDTDEATITDCEIARHGDDPQEYCGSGRTMVTAMPFPTSQIDFAVDVPKDGLYTLGLTYGSDGHPASTTILVDGVLAMTPTLPATLSKAYAGRVDSLLQLASGPHQISVSARKSSETKFSTDIAVDRIALTRAHNGLISQRLDAASAWRSDGAQVDYDAAITGPARVVLATEESLTFTTAVPQRGRYELRFVVDVISNATFVVAVDGRAVIDSPIDIGNGQTVRRVVALPVGVSIVTLTVLSGTVGVHSLVVHESHEELAHRLAAEDFQLHGAAIIDRSTAVPFLDALGTSSEGGVIEGSISAELDALKPGTYLMTVTYSNADRRSGHLYNADVISRVLRFRRGTDTPQTIYFRHNYSWSNYQDLSVHVSVDDHAGPVLLDGLHGPGPRVVAIEWEPLTIGKTIITGPANDG